MVSGSMLTLGQALNVVLAEADGGGGSSLVALGLVLALAALAIAGAWLHRRRHPRPAPHSGNPPAEVVEFLDPPADRPPPDR